MSGRIITGDVLKVLSKQNGADKFSLVIANPPYNIGKDFGNTQNNMPLDEYVAWCEQWLIECFRLLVDDGLIYVYGFAEILARVAARHDYEAQHWLVWDYKNEAISDGGFWQRAHESILCLWHPEHVRPPLEIDQIREPYTPRFINNAVGRTRTSTPSRFGGQRGRKTVYRAHPNGALPRDVIQIPTLAGGAEHTEQWFRCIDCDDKIFPPTELKAHRNHQIWKHPTQKPIGLPIRLIRSRINGNGGRVLVPFAGSGSECVAAQTLGIDYLGIERDPRTARFGRARLKHTQTQNDRGATLA